ncbi:MAG: ChuX/HutX family heme-like substrate-binding protein [Pseudomonadota bacterium]
MTAESQVLVDFQALRAANPTIRAVDAASKLGVSEGALLDARAGAGEVERLAPTGVGFADLLRGLGSVGRVMTLTRNDAAVHETKGTFGEVAIQERMGQVTGEIDLRLFLSHWHAGYSIAEETKSGLRRSFQIFDKSGRPVLKVFDQDATDGAAWQDLDTAYLAGRDARVTYDAPPPPVAETPDAEIDVTALREGWQALEHSHDFFGLLRRIGAGRVQALRLAGPDLAATVDPAALTSLLEGAARQSVPIMCFVGNPGCLQIFSGPIQRVAMMGPWLNILDPDFNLHMRTDQVASAWLVRKPTKLRGLITSVEMFTADGTLACQFFGARPPGANENPAWRSLAETLTPEA